MLCQQGGYWIWRVMDTFFCSLCAIILLTTCDLCAADQLGAEIAKQPLSAEIIVSGASSGSKADATLIGDVQVTYIDGTKDRWTSKGNCSLARVAPDGTVGWTVSGRVTKVNASYSMRPNDTLVLCRKGKVITQINSALGFIEEWKFIDDGRQLVLVTRASHGPAAVELHDVVSGKLLDSVKAYGENLPVWAKPYKE